MKTVHFGFGVPFAVGESPSVGLNRRGTVVLVHQFGAEKHYRVGRVSEGTVLWEGTKPAGRGETPGVALNNNDVAVEVHRNPDPEHQTLYCRAGRVGVPRRDEVAWPNAFRYAEGANRFRPSVALNDAGVVVEMHEVREGTGNSAKYFLEWVVGRVRDTGGQIHLDMPLNKHERYGEATMPAIAIDNRGTVVQIHRYPRGTVDRRLFSAVGRVVGTRIEFHERQPITLPRVPPVEGHYPSVAITDEGMVIVVFRTKSGIHAVELIGEFNAERTAVTWRYKRRFDDGTTPAVATAGALAIAIHQHEKKSQLYFSTSLITERASWMQNHSGTLGQKRLRDLVLPASHDAGMYKGNLPALARNQHLTIYEQLNYGIRYFDLRASWLGRKWLISHGVMPGPEVQTVLNDVRQFATHGYRELVILKVSHLQYVDNNSYKILAGQIVDTIGPWLVKSKPGGKRFGDVTLREYVESVAGGPAVLVVVDRDFAINNREEGIWVYRDWNVSRDEARKGDLCVYDMWSGTEDFAIMRADQHRKFANYDGRMLHAPDVPCDLFLLSWTLTPQGVTSPSPLTLSRRTNLWLGSDIRDGNPPPAIPNEHGMITNALYVDFVETARVTDIALFQNGLAATPG